MGRVLATAIALSVLLAGCATVGKSRRLSDRECLARAMYFESNRSSEDGMLGVGTVVMNRYESGKYGKSVCAVVGAPRQFAPGVLSNPMTEPKSAARAMKVAGEVLGGARHPTVGKAQFFHTAGYQPGYNNMRYVSIEGGNAFYEKVKKGEDTGDLVRVARNGPSDIDDLITINQRTLVGQKPIPKLAPVDGSQDAAPPENTQPVYAPPAPSRRSAVQRQAIEPQIVEPQIVEPGPGWQVGPSGRIY